MSIKTIPVPENAQITIRAHADLALQGWEKPEIRALSDSRRSVSVQNTGDMFSITCADDCDLTVPSSARVVVERIGGDALLRDLKGGLVIQKVGGDLSVQGMDGLEILSVGGDCCACNVSGPLTIQRIGGDLNGTDIQGFLSVSNVGGDLQMQLGANDVSVNVRGDADLALKSLSGQKVNVNSSGDATLHLPQPADADISLVCGGDIKISTPTLQEEADHVYSGKLGSGGTRISVHAGGDIELTSEPSDEDMLRPVAHLQEEWAELEERRANIIEDAAEQHDAAAFFGIYQEGPDVIIHTDELSERARKTVEQKMRQAQDRIDRAMKRIDERTRRMMDFGVVPPPPPAPPVPPAPPDFSARAPEARQAAAPGADASKVSDEERMLILKMLQEKKITAEEAENLLEALEG